jgi:hypothetical protein
MQTLFMRLRFQHGRLDNLKTLHPAYFALVMATGIVSIATHLHGIPVLPAVLARASFATRGLSPPTSKAIAAV